MVSSRHLNSAGGMKNRCDSSEKQNGSIKGPPHPRKKMYIPKKANNPISKNSSKWKVSNNKKLYTQDIHDVIQEQTKLKKWRLSKNIQQWIAEITVTLKIKKIIQSENVYFIMLSKKE